MDDVIKGVLAVFGILVFLLALAGIGSLPDRISEKNMCNTFCQSKNLSKCTDTYDSIEQKKFFIECDYSNIFSIYTQSKCHEYDKFGDCIDSEEYYVELAEDKNE